MADPGEIVGLLTGGGASVLGLYKVGEWLVKSRFDRAEKTEADAEAAKAKATEDLGTKLEQVLAVVTKMDREFAVMARDLSTTTGSVGEVKARIDGLSANHGPRLAKLEEEMARIDERLKKGRR